MSIYKIIHTPKIVIMKCDVKDFDWESETSI